MRVDRRVALLVAAVGTLLVHFAWELGQAPAFAPFASTTSKTLAHCFRAALGDLGIAAGSYVVPAVLFLRWDWAMRDGWRGPAALWLAAGLTVTIAFERWALATGRWAYGPEMPVVWGIGLWPLLQWLVVPALTLAVLRAVARK